MTNPKRGELQITLGQTTWTARVTMDALARVETACGAGIVKILGKLTEGDLTTTEICNILLPIIKGGGNDVSIKDIQKVVWDAGLAEAMKACGEVLATALSGAGNEGNVMEAAE
jgi:hypothetical protein